MILKLGKNSFQMKINKNIEQLLKCIIIGGTFFSVDFLLRVYTRWLGYYSIYELAPSLFSICWIMIFIAALSVLPHTAGRITYISLYSVWAIYSVCQYIYYLIFNKFFFLSDVRNLSEGKHYAEYIFDIITTDFFLLLIILIALGIFGFFLYPNFREFSTTKIRNRIRAIFMIAALIGIINIPTLYKENKQALFFSSKYEYEQFTNSAFDLEITGIYQYVARDIWKNYIQPKDDMRVLCDVVDSFLLEKENHKQNKFTGIFKDKNIILIQMESIDDWVLSKETMPTVFRLMNEGINFTNMYTCLYGSGWTFSTEFAFNAGVYQSTKGIAAYSMSQNYFPFSIANILNKEGYSCLSFHQNTGNFYSRSSIHPALGYTKYVSTSEIVSDHLMADSDISMIEDDNIWGMISAPNPFLSFINTYGAHVPYSYDDPLVQWAFSQHPEYNLAGRDLEINAIYAKARTLDDMFDALLKRLDEDGLLSDTVIIAYADHYCYGLTDKEIVHQLSAENGSDILERTPAFIWYEGCESMEVDKVCQTIDWVPTIANLFGIDVSQYVLGNDIFDDAYEGYAIFPDGTWLTNKAYAVNGIVHRNNGMTNQEITEMNEYVQEFYLANEAILASDYYAKFENDF